MGLLPPTERILANQNRAPAGRLRNGVLTLNLELRTGMFRPHADDGPGVEVQAFGEAGRPLQIPGPLIRVPEGTVIHATIRNRLRDSTLVLHGFAAHPGQPDDSLVVPPGATRSVRFDAGRAGTYYYWGTTTGQAHGGRPLDRQPALRRLHRGFGGRTAAGERAGVRHGPLAQARGGRPGGEFMVINGKGWPETERLDYQVGDTVRWRWLNPTSSSHPMHLHGFYYEVDSRGGWAADTVYAPADRRLVVTELMPPGGTMTARWTPVRPGNWLFHCHFAFHISNEQSLSADTAAPGGHDGEHMAHPHGRPRAGPARGARQGAPTAAAPAPAEPRKLRLLVQAARSPADSAHLMGYALQEGDVEPARDSAPVPGPTLVLERGRPVRITVVNRLTEPTAVHWHGIELESFPDGVPGWSGTPDHLLAPIAPGDSFIAEFTPPRAGTFIYHSHAHELFQIPGGLYGRDRRRTARRSL